jgi:pyruvate kinase
MDERSDSHASRGHILSDESASHTIAMHAVTGPLDALRESEIPKNHAAIKTHRLFDHLNVVRALATPTNDPPIKSHAVLEPLDALREAASSRNDPPVKPQGVLQQLDGLRDGGSARDHSAIKALRMLEEPDALRDPVTSRTHSPIKSPRLLEPVEDPRESGTSSNDQSLDSRELLEQLDILADELARAAPENPEALQALHPSHRLSGYNLLHYLALRRREIRPLQARLADQGLASLGLSEAHVAASLHAVRTVLHQLLGRTHRALHGTAPTVAQGLELLARCTGGLLGPQPDRRRVRIMVTISAEEAKGGTLIPALVQSGMNCLRINCAHDGPEEWLAIVQQVRATEKELGQSCKILMDMSGPKLRTGPIELGPPMLKWRPVKNRLGQLIRPAIIALAPRDGAPPVGLHADGVLGLPTEFLEDLRPREELKLKDARGVPRRLVVRAKHGAVWLAEGHSTTYVTDGTVLRSKRSDRKAEVRGLPRVEDPILLETGDTLRLAKSLKPGRPAIRDCSGRLLQPAVVGCTLGEAFCQLRTGQRVLIDDGKIECVIRSADADGVLLDVVRAPEGGAKLRGDRGLNFPDSRLRLPGLTAKDFQDLSFIAQHADMVGFSFVQRPDEVFQLQQHLSRLGKPDLGIVLKIETRRAFENLPALLWAAMRSDAVGVMIARGDLAVECGYERLAELQEEILWLCEAAHLPVIWATQVLETLAKEGVPSRPEITDAAMSERAECVMLNKGPHIEKAVISLDTILSRMQSHQSTKTPMPRELHSWDRPPWP